MGDKLQRSCQKKKNEGDKPSTPWLSTVFQKTSPRSQEGEKEGNQGRGKVKVCVGRGKVRGEKGCFPVKAFFEALSLDL